MTYKENITAILECYFTGFKEEIIDSACNRILEQQPCEDCISREDALQALCKAVHKNDNTIPCLNQRVSCLWDKTKVQDYAKEILKLPSVTPKEKTGHWIDDGQYAEGHSEHAYRCSKCDETYIGYTEKYKYCPNCGAKMVEP